MDQPERLLRLLQLSDSGFPTGAFAFSHGLEGLFAANAVNDEGDVAQFIAVHLREGFAGIDCPFMILSRRAAHERNIARLVELDAQIDAFKPVPVFRSGSIRTGRRLVESATGVLSSPMLDELREQIQAGGVSGHHSLAFGVVMEAAGIDEETAALALGFGFVAGLATAAVRVGVIGQRAAQRIIAALHVDVVSAAERGRTTPIEDMGAFTPMIDIAGLRQPNLAGRIFAS